MPISSSVMTTFSIRNNSAGSIAELLVLWRGTPGWYARGGTSSSSGSGSLDVWSERFSNGGLEFELSGDFATGTVTLLGQTITLKGANVILVDDVDSAKGARIVRTLTVDGQVSEDRSPVRVLPVLGRSQELRDYLRCEVPLPDPKYQAQLASICARVLAEQPR